MSLMNGKKFFKGEQKNHRKVRQTVETFLKISQKYAHFCTSFCAFLISREISLLQFLCFIEVVVNINLILIGAPIRTLFLSRDLFFLMLNAKCAIWVESALYLIQIGPKAYLKASMKKERNLQETLIKFPFPIYNRE